MSEVTSPSRQAHGNPGGALRSLLNELNTSAGALAALGAALEARAAGHALAPGLAAAVSGVLEALGVATSLAALAPGELGTLLAELRVFAASHRQLAAPRPPDPGWAPACPALIQAAGEVSATLPRFIERTIAPRLAGLADRLATPGARFLDVGAGAAALSIEMARTWPALAVVGLEPWGPALDIARANVLAAGLRERVELRADRAEELADAASYDLAWVPSFFVGEPALGRVLERVRCALRAGAWLILPVLQAEPDTLGGSVVRLRAALWGGSAPTLGEAAARLSAAGFIDLESLASSPGGATGLLAGRAAVLREPRP
jgi:SAM-dependent methyltransferase